MVLPVRSRVSCKTGFVSIQPKQEPKEVSKLSETKGFVSVLSEYTETGMFQFFWLFRFNQKEPKKTKGGGKGEKRGRKMEGKEKGNEGKGKIKGRG